MNIDLDTIRSTLRYLFGRDSFVASFITTVHEDEHCGTACITKQGELRYSAQFVKKYVDTEQDLRCLILHELMHPMFGHFIYGGGQLENFAADCVINAVVSKLFHGPTGWGSLFRKFYSPQGIEGLLRAMSEMRHSRYSDLYNTLYVSECPGKEGITTGEVITSLKVLAPLQEVDKVTLLGDHQSKSDDRSNDGPAAEPLSGETVSNIAAELNRAARKHADSAGTNSSLYDLLLDVLKPHLGLKRTLLQRFATQEKVGRFLCPEKRPSLTVSPIPLQPSKRDLVFLAADLLPWHFHNQVSRIAPKKQGIVIYLDVSGSVNQHLPDIVALLRRYQHELQSVFLFSNAVVESSLQVLLTGKIKTTYGTDFDCIATHLLAKGFDKAVVLTDGYAGMSEENQAALGKRKVRVLSILFGGKEDCPEFEPLGPVLQLDEVVD